MRSSFVLAAMYNRKYEFEPPPIYGIDSYHRLKALPVGVG